MFARALKNQKKSSQATIEDPDCFSSSWRKTTAGEKLSPEFIVFFDINPSRVLPPQKKEREGTAK